MPRNWKAVFCVVERLKRKYWLRVGMAFVNRDGSLNVRLDAVPLTGQLHIRDDVNRPNPDEAPAPSESLPHDAAPNERKRTS